MMPCGFQAAAGVSSLFKGLIHNLMTGKLRVKDLAVPGLEWKNS